MKFKRLRQHGAKLMALVVNLLASFVPFLFGKKDRKPAIKKVIIWTSI